MARHPSPSLPRQQEPPLSTGQDAEPTSAASICLSIVSHGQREVALALLEDIARLRPAQVARIIYTRNIAEAPLPRIDFGGMALTVVDNEHAKGFSANHNAAFEFCREPCFCVMNPDLRFDGDPFPSLLSILMPAADNWEESGRAAMGLVAPVILDPQGSIQNTARTLYTPSEMVSQKLRPRNEGAAADWVAGMFMLFRSEAYASIRGFDERYFLYIEDVDICSRLVDDGWRLAQVPQARVIHDARKASHRSLRYTLWHLAGMLRYWTGRSYRDHRRLLRRRLSSHG